MAQRVTQAPVEVLAQPTSQKARVTQAPVEVLALPSSQKAIVSQAVVEVLWLLAGAGYGGEVRFSAQFVE